MDGQDYNYFMATKLQTYLRAGLPILIDADNHYMAGLVEKYKIGGGFWADEDYENLPAILNRVDLSALKANVIKCRDEFSIEKGGRKVLQMYHEILKSGDQKQAVPAGDSAPARLPQRSGSDPAFGEWIASMAQAENRLYYRDQSTETMASLARYARELQPSVVVEMGTLAGLSLRTWVAATERTKIHAIDLSFKKLHETKALLSARFVTRDPLGTGHSQNGLRLAVERKGHGNCLRGCPRFAQCANHGLCPHHGLTLSARGEHGRGG